VCKCVSELQENCFRVFFLFHLVCKALNRLDMDPSHSNFMDTSFDYINRSIALLIV